MSAFAKVGTGFAFETRSKPLNLEHDFIVL